MSTLLKTTQNYYKTVKITQKSRNTTSQNNTLSSPLHLTTLKTTQVPKTPVILTKTSLENTPFPFIRSTRLPLPLSISLSSQPPYFPDVQYLSAWKSKVVPSKNGYSLHPNSQLTHY